MKTLCRKYPKKAYSEKETPWKSLVFTVLSARSRDEQTEIVYRALLKRYPSSRALAAASHQNIAKIIRKIGLFRNKAKNLSVLAQKIADEHGGRVPADFEDLRRLPGVGRKTANCVLVYAFHKPAVCVDTHVHRVTNRLGWARAKSPEKTEFALRKVVPKKFWMDINRVMVWFGRSICLPGRPKCWMCPVRDWCKYPYKNTMSLRVRRNGVKAGEAISSNK